MAMAYSYEDAMPLFIWNVVLCFIPCPEKWSSVPIVKRFVKEPPKNLFVGVKSVEVVMRRGDESPESAHPNPALSANKNRVSVTITKPESTKKNFKQVNRFSWSKWIQKI